MEALDYWKLCKKISLFQAILLISGYDPGNDKGAEFERNRVVPEGYGAIKTALLEAIESKEVEASIGEEYNYDHNGEVSGTIPDTINIDCQRRSESVPAGRSKSVPLGARERAPMQRERVTFLGQRLGGCG